MSAFAPVVTTDDVGVDYGISDQKMLAPTRKENREATR